MNWDMALMILIVAAGGAIGAVLRYLVGHFVDSSSFPYATFIVNIVGCFLISLIFFSYQQEVPENIRLFLFIGIFGAFTTMSTFTLETVTLFFDGEMVKAGLNFVLNAGVCVLGAVGGRYLALLLF